MRFLLLTLIVLIFGFVVGTTDHSVIREEVRNTFLGLFVLTFQPVGGFGEVIVDEVWHRIGSSTEDTGEFVCEVSFFTTTLFPLVTEFFLFIFQPT